MLRHSGRAPSVPGDPERQGLPDSRQPSRRSLQPRHLSSCVLQLHSEPKRPAIPKPGQEQTDAATAPSARGSAPLSVLKHRPKLRVLAGDSSQTPSRSLLPTLLPSPVAPGGDQGSSLDFCVCLLGHIFVLFTSISVKLKTLRLLEILDTNPTLLNSEIGTQTKPSLEVGLTQVQGTPWF